MEQKNTKMAEVPEAQPQKMEPQDQLAKNVSDTVLKRINELVEAGQIKMPTGYNPGNALKAAWLILQTVEDKNKNPALQVCTKTSIVNSLFDMCIQGLSPAKKQCYFIVRGDLLTLSRSYFGTVAVLKRLKGVEDVFAQVVYRGDVFEYVIDGGNIIVTKHEQKLENIDMNNIVGAYCTIVKDSKQRSEVMTMAQIKQSWTHRSNNGGVQNEFPDQMAKRTVINRGAKMYVNTSDDADELVEAINHSTEAEYEDAPVENGEPISIPAQVQPALPEAQPANELPVPTGKVAEPVPERRRPGF